MRRVTVLLVFVLIGLGACTTSTQPSYIYGERPDSLNFPKAPRLTPLQQLEGYFTDPYYWPSDLDPAT
ncbi:MAG: hypothetical protein AAF556_05280 [Pseudomonadota bacterium]